MAKKSTIETVSTTEEITPSVAIMSRIAGFRRGGVAHPLGPVVYPVGTFTVEQLDQIRAEPNLSMRELPIVADLEPAATVVEQAAS